MALLLIEGFERFSGSINVAEGISFNDTIVYSASNSGRLLFQTTTGRLGHGTAVRPNRIATNSGSQNTYITFLKWRNNANVTFVNNTTYTVGFALNVNNNSSNSDIAAGVHFNVGPLDIRRQPVSSTEYQIRINGVNYGPILTQHLVLHRNPMGAVHKWKFGYSHKWCRGSNHQ